MRFLIGMLTSAAFGIYPYVLPSILDPARGLTVSNAAAPESGLRIGSSAVDRMAWLRAT
jgi:cytochrome bd-type quinol oxidase subunit 2